MDVIEILDSSDEANEKFEICRLCGQESVYYVPIFGENTECIPEKISRCLSIIISPNDKLPSNVCKRCLHHLNISYKLVLTSVEVDNRLRMQLVEKSKTDLPKEQDIETPCKTYEISDVKSIRFMSLKDLKIQAITGPAECDICNLKFQDLDEFDTHMEQLHFLKWRCSLCDNTFHESNELIQHKILKHGGNIIICGNCRKTSDQNKKQEITSEKWKETTIKKHMDQNCQKEITSEKQKETVFNTTDETNKNVAVSFINTQNGDDSWDAAAVETDFMQVSEQSDTSNSETNAIIKKWSEILQKLKRSEDGKEQMFCEFCKIRFGNKYYFDAHNKIHEEKKAACATCRVECPSIYELFLHKREVHQKFKKVQLKYVCSKCGKFFTNSWNWETHKRDECIKMANRFCKYCNTMFPTNLKLMHHLRKHKMEMLSDPTVTVYKCIACPKVFVDKEFYEKHRNVHDPECWDKFKCTLCDKPFRDKFRLRDHQLAVHENTKPHQCDICERRFLRLHNMTVHRKIHFGRKCNHCDAVFKRVSELMQHIQEIHDIKSNMQRQFTRDSYICRFCGKKLCTQQSLMSHERIHTGEKPFSCSICHKTFRSYTTRWTHIQRHQKGNFICEYCGKFFSYKQNLIVHIQTHLPMEDRKYQCNVCGKKFMRKPHLTIHKRIHDGVRPYTCDICSASFTQKGDMKRHRIRHFKGETKAKSVQSQSSVHIE